MVMPSVTEQIKATARRMGFSHVGVARASALTEEHARLSEWIARGDHGAMAYLARDTARRSDPGLVLPGARSVVVVAQNYFTNDTHSDDTKTGKISRYAWGDDYHDIIPPLLAEIEDTIRALCPDAQTRRYVDTGPVMEKAWAARAGIGWIGKHTNLITRDLGSWVFLGVILTTAGLEYDTPAIDHCGDCTRCLDACPTSAIAAPYRLDATRCIPYLTIEWRADEIPGGERMDFNNWIFGCDICQDVCPWNSFQQATREPRYAPRPEVLSLSLEEAAQMDEQRFRTMFRRTPVTRAKLAGLQRNARTVLRQQSSYAATDTKP